ncbi:hypothetical protein KR009_000862 [Drosophila setifemur]|nr:hypothetical protein KR009_000862 [Drosophila setifemur]
MTLPENSEDKASSSNDDQDDETRRILKSIDSFEEVYNTYKSKSTQELSAPPSNQANGPDNLKAKTSSPAICTYSKCEENRAGTDPAHSNSVSPNFLKHIGVSYSHIRIESGGVRTQKGQAMDHRDYSLSEYPVCGPLCSWQSSAVCGQDLLHSVPNGKADLEMSQYRSGYTCGHSLPEANSGSNETIVNGPTAPEVSTCTMESYGHYCPKGPSVQPGSSCPCEHRNPGLLPDYYYQASAGHSMPAFGMDQTQRAGCGQNIGEKSQQSSAASGTHNHNMNGFDMRAFVNNYQPGIQECYAIDQQGVQRFSAQAQCLPFYPNYSQGIQRSYTNFNQEISLTDAQQTYPCQSVPQACSSALGAQQFYDCSIPGSEQYFPSPSLALPAPCNFGKRSALACDSIQAHSVYSSDYKPYSTNGNNFNHFPNGMDIGLAPESCHSYAPAETAGLVEMSAGGQDYGTRGGYPMELHAYPLSHMSYSTPHSFNMPASTSGYHQALGYGMATVCPKVSNGN